MAGELVPNDFTHGYYEFKGIVGGESLDDSGNSFHFTVNGAVDSVTGKFNNGLEFDGDNDTATSAQSRFADLTDQLGYIGWMQILRTSTGVDGYIWKGGNGGTEQDAIIFGNNDTKIYSRINNTATQAASAELGISSPFFFAVNYDGANISLHWNDPTVNSSIVARAAGNIRNTGPLNIGSQNGNISNSQMLISQLGVRNAPFTMDEMVYMYNGGAGRLLVEGGFQAAWARNSNQIIGMP